LVLVPNGVRDPYDLTNRLGTVLVIFNDSKIFRWSPLVILVAIGFPRSARDKKKASY
jgi:hypothetical protein